MAGYFTVDQLLMEVTNEEFGLSDEDYSENEVVGIYAQLWLPEIDVDQLDLLANTVLDYEVELLTCSCGLQADSSGAESDQERLTGLYEALAIASYKLVIATKLERYFCYCVFFPAQCADKASLCHCILANLG